MDWLEEQWKGKLKSIGMSDTDATLLARIKAKMERDEGFKIGRASCRERVSSPV